MKYIIAALIILTGRKSAEKLASEKAAKEDRQRKEYVKLLYDTRKALPCDTITKYYIDTVETLLPADTAYFNDTVVIQMPGKEIYHKEVNVVVDSAYAEQLLMQLESVQYASQLQAEENIEQDLIIQQLKDKNSDLKTVNNRFAWIITGLGVLMLGSMILRVKNII